MCVCVHTRACVRACLRACLFKFVNKTKVKVVFEILWIVQLKQICQHGFRFFVKSALVSSLTLETFHLPHEDSLNVLFW